MRAHTRTHARTQARMHTHTHARTHRHIWMHTCMRLCTHVCTHKRPCGMHTHIWTAILVRRATWTHARASVWCMQVSGHARRRLRWGGRHPALHVWHPLFHTWLRHVLAAEGGTRAHAAPAGVARVLCRSWGRQRLLLWVHMHRLLGGALSALDAPVPWASALGKVPWAGAGVAGGCGRCVGCAGALLNGCDACWLCCEVCKVRWVANMHKGWQGQHLGLCWACGSS